MKDGPLDPRIDKMVALLYGELPEDEAREVRKMIDADPALRREWEGLQGTRAMIGEWKLEEAQSPGFVFVDDAAPSVRRRTGGWIERLRSFTAVTPWAVAAAAVVIAVFAVNGVVRIERTEGSVALRIGRAPATTALQVAANVLPNPGRETAFPLTGTQVQPAVQQASTTTEGAAASGSYLTKQEFEAYSAGMMQSLVVLLNEYGKQHDREVGGVLQTALAGVQARQARDYGDLRNQIQTLGVGVGNLDYRLQQTHQPQEVGPMPVNETPAAGTEGEGK